MVRCFFDFGQQLGRTLDTGIKGALGLNPGVQKQNTRERVGDTPTLPCGTSFPRTILSFYDVTER